MNEPLVSFKDLIIYLKSIYKYMADKRLTLGKNIESRVTQKNTAQAYWQLRPLWNQYLELYEPLPTTLIGYLQKYPKEDQDEFYQRAKTCTQINIMDYCIDFLCSMLFSTSIQFTSETMQDEVDSFTQNCNSSGDTLTEYLREIIAPATLLYGSVDVMVDKPSLTGLTPNSLADEQAMGINMPYCYIIPPLNRMDWIQDNQGNYIYLKCQDVINTQLAAQMGIIDERQFQVWTLTEIAQYNNKGFLIGNVMPNPYNFIPAITFTYKKSQRFYNNRIGVSYVKDILDMQKMMLNIISLIFDYHQSVNFPTRVFIQDTDEGEPLPTDEVKEMGTHRGVNLLGESDFKLVSPDPSGAHEMQCFLDKLFQTALLVCNCPNDAMTSKSHTTEGSIKTSYAKLYNFLTNVSRHFGKSAKQVVELSLKLKGYSDDEIKKAKVTVTWDTNWSFEALSDNLQNLILMKTALSGLVSTAEKEFAKRVIAPELFNSSKWDEMVKEIDETEPPQPLVEPMPSAGVVEPLISKSGQEPAVSEDND
jgi:hypothetical protein